MHARALTAEEIDGLVGYISERHGLALSRGFFADALLAVLEDVPGFEATPPSQAKNLIHQLWSIYRGQEDR